MTASLGAINIDVSKVKDTLAKVDIHNWLLCFDDINTDKLKEVTESIFSDDILYKSIREKVIGLTVGFDPQMDKAFNSIISDMKVSAEFNEYLQEKKKMILKYFDEEECLNLRTMIITSECLKKLFNEMYRCNFHTTEFYDQIMHEFLKYIVRFTIYYRNGGKVSDLQLTSEIGYIPLGSDLFKNTRGFKFLEKYCTTLRFSNESLKNAVCV